MDSVNFTLNTADWKMMKIPFNTTGNKWAWKQFLIEYCCNSFGSTRTNKTLRECLVTKNTCLIYYAAKLASNQVEILKLHQKQQRSHKFQLYETSKRKLVNCPEFTMACSCFPNPNNHLPRETFTNLPEWVPSLHVCTAPNFFFSSYNLILSGSVINVSLPQLHWQLYEGQSPQDWFPACLVLCMRHDRCTSILFK